MSGRETGKVHFLSSGIQKLLNQLLHQMSKKYRQVLRSNHELASKENVNHKQAFKDPKLKWKLQDYLAYQTFQAALKQLNWLIINYI